mgnify:CR=1 FL=1
MSLAVLRRKANEKTKLNMQNRYAGQRGQPFALNIIGRGTVRSNPVVGSVDKNRCCPPTGFANVSDDKKVLIFFVHHNQISKTNFFQENVLLLD